VTTTRPLCGKLIDVNVESIKQKPSSSLADGNLPDFRNLGVWLRILLLTNLLALATVAAAHDFDALRAPLLEMAGRVELPLLLCLLVLYLLGPTLQKRRYRLAAIAVVIVVQVVITLPFALFHEGDAAWRWRLWALVASALCLFYFDYRGLRLSPAHSEARLMALTARIRPHFLFNALNGILGVIRSDPRRAERALEELAELFRTFMRDNRELVPLAQELALCERYIDVETLRLGERLQIRWDIRNEAVRKALVPPLLLQPLLENAIYHGIEPSASPGKIRVRIALRSGPQLKIDVENPVVAGQPDRPGNHMALENIRERLMLFFDLEARLDTIHTGNRYRVSVRMPYRKIIPRNRA